MIAYQNEGETTAPGWISTPLDRERTEKRRAEDRRGEGGTGGDALGGVAYSGRVRGVSAEADCSHTLTLHLLPSPYAHIDFLWHLFLSYSNLVITVWYANAATPPFQFLFDRVFLVCLRLIFSNFIA
jgi:hypothetical protein